MANESIPKNQITVTLGFEPEALGRLDEIVEITGAKSRADVLILAMRLYDFVNTECDPAKGVTVTRNDGTEQTFYGNDF